MDLDTIILKLMSYLRIMHGLMDVELPPTLPHPLFLPPRLCWEGLQDLAVLPPPLSGHCPGM